MDRYEKALAKARAEYEKARKQGYTWLMDLLEGMFPELRESEDERIRKDIIHYILYKADGVSEKQEHEWVAWLEKQKENPDRLILIGKAKSEKQVVLLAESNGDENIYWDTKSEEDAVNLLEKGLKFFGKQKPAEWSEEDERMRNQLIYDVEYHKKEGLVSAKKNKATEALYNGIEKCYDEKIAWLKSLRPPQYCENCKLKRSVENWKPSKEQMGMLLAVINDPNNAGAESCHLMLQSLFADLQKLLSHEIH